MMWSFHRGGTADVDIVLSNDLGLTAFEMYLTLPQGVSCKKATPNIERLIDHSTTITGEGDEVIITSFSGNNTVFDGNQGSLLTLTLEADASLLPGAVFTAMLHDMEFATPAEEMVFPENVTFSISIAETPKSVVSVENIDLPQGGTGSIVIGLNNEKALTAFEMYLSLPNGINYVGYETNSARLTDHSTSVTADGNNVTMTSFSGNNTVFVGNNGALLTITVSADAGLVPGTVLVATLHDMEFATPEEMMDMPDDVTFTITIVDPLDSRIVLDENSSTLPENAEGVNVKVIRTLYANEWSTIVLPFAMREEQLVSAFGEEVKLADFTSWYSEKNDEGEIVNINVMFTRVEMLEANHPYIIKVSEKVTDFTADNVDIDVDGQPMKQVGQKKAERGKFIGTYSANTVVPEENLFISGNKFWYSVGETRMKAFRAYFEFADVLDAYYESEHSNVSFSFVDADGISLPELNVQQDVDGIFDLQGRKVAKDETGLSSLGKGIYIVNGKKVAR